MKPFQNAGQYTVFENAILDTVLPMCSPNEWKILCVAIRKTVGWHKKEDVISLSQFQKASGMSRPTVIKATEEAVNHGFLIRTKKGNSFSYQLNTELEIGKEPLPPTSKESLPSASKESLPTKETIKEINTTTLNPSDLPKTPEPKKPEPPEHCLMFETLSGICKADMKLMSGRIGKTVKQLREAGYTNQDLKNFEKYWYRNDWRGKKNQAPTLPQVIENILKAKPSQPRKESVTAYKHKDELEEKRRLQEAVKKAINSLETEEGRSATFQEIESIQHTILVGEPA